MSLALTRWRYRWLALALLWLCLIAYVLPARADGQVELAYFYDAQCSTCAEVHREVLEPLIEQYGQRLRVVEIEISDDEAFEVLLALEQEHGIWGGEIPEVFVGDLAFVGADAVRQGLAEAVARYAEQGGVSLPPVVADYAARQEAPVEAPCEICDEKAPAGDLAASGSDTASGTVVHVLLFWSPTCPACHKVIEEVLPPLQEQYGDALVVDGVSIATEEAQTFWFQVMAEAGLGRDSAYVPMLFIGDRVLIGSKEIAEELPALIDAHLAAGGLPALPALAENAHLVGRPGASGEGSAATTSASPTATPASLTSEKPPIHAVYFYQAGCDVCERAERDLSYMQTQYPQLVVERYDIREAAALNEYLSQRVGLEDRLRLVAPSFFVGDAYLIGSDVRAQGLRRVLEPYLETGSERFWEGYEEASHEAEQSIVRRFLSLNLLAVAGAGLLDGVNPCAFATMIFLVSYLTIRKRARRELLLTGIAFTAGVFVAYTGIGLGMFRALNRWSALEVIGRWIYLATAVLCLALAWGSFADYRKARQGRLEEMTLKLPKRLTNVNRKLIREGVGARGFVLTSFALGLVVSLIEMACTGQVYLPTIVFVLGVPELCTRATAALLLYNLMFILPLVVVFLLVYYGTTSQQLIAWLKRRTAAVKLATGVLFLVLSAWLVYSVVTMAV